MTDYNYDLAEMSLDRATPITLYKFRGGDGDADWLGYTDHEVEIRFEGVAYKPVPIKRSDITRNGSLDKTAVEITLPRYESIVELFQVFPPSFVVETYIYEGHFDDPTQDYRLVLAGRTLNCSNPALEATLTVEPIATAMRRRGTRRNWQYPCPHVLYGDECRATRVLEELTVVSVMSGNIIVVHPSTTISDPSHFETGVVRWTDSAGSKRLLNIIEVLTESGGNLLLSLTGIVLDVEVGMTMQMTKGCPHTFEACSSRFNNIVNFGGHPWIPLENPVGSLTTFL